MEIPCDRGWRWNDHAVRWTEQDSVLQGSEWESRAIEGDGRPREFRSSETEREMSWLLGNGNPMQSRVMGDRGTMDRGRQSEAEQDSVMHGTEWKSCAIEGDGRSGTMVRGRPSETERETSCLLGNGNPMRSRAMGHRETMDRGRESQAQQDGVLHGSEWESCAIGGDGRSGDQRA